MADNSGSSCCFELHTSLYPLSVGRVVRREGSIHVAEEFVSCLLHQKGWFGHGQFLPVPGGVGWTSSCLVVELYHVLEARGLEEEFWEDVLRDSSDGWEVTYLQYQGGGGNAILGYFRPYLSRAIFGFLRCTWPKIALKLKQVNICSSN